MQESEIAKSRDRSSRIENRRLVKNVKTININKNAKNVKNENEMLNKKKQAFQNSTTKEFSQFKRVEIEMTIIHENTMNSKTTLVVHRADSVSNRRRDRKRDKRRKRSRNRERRNREREQAMSKETK
jgi:hypothetical protein